MPSSLTKRAAARRYLEASRASGISDSEARGAHHATMRELERKHPGVREHAMAGENRDFDEPLEAGLKAEQRRLRESTGFEHQDVLAARRNIRQAPGRLAASRPQQRRRGNRAPSAGRKAAAAGAAATGGAIQSVVGGGGGGFMYLIGVALLLSLVYLLVAGKGAPILGGIVASLTGAVHAFVNPNVDPIAKLETAFGAEPPSASSASLAGIHGAVGPSAPTGRFAPPPGQVGKSLGRPEHEPAGRGGTSAEKAYLGVLAKAAGWSRAAVNAWEQVIERESGWNPHAQNKETNAYGIGQFNPSTPSQHGTPQHPAPGSTFEQYLHVGAGGTWKEQLNAMALYIQHTYGNPIAALASEHTRGFY